MTVLLELCLLYRQVYSALLVPCSRSSRSSQFLRDFVCDDDTDVGFLGTKRDGLLPVGHTPQLRSLSRF